MSTIFHEKIYWRHPDTGIEHSLQVEIEWQQAEPDVGLSSGPIILDIECDTLSINEIKERWQELTEHIEDELD